MIETHCHLNDIERIADPLLEIEESQRAGVSKLIVVGINENWSERAVMLAEEHPSVYATVGIHPTEIGSYDARLAKRLVEWLDHRNVVALGEIGLDYHWDTTSPHDQIIAFRAQLEIARTARCPVVIHCRDAYDDLLALLADYPDVPFLLHCFAGNAIHAELAIKLGCYFGVDGPLTYPKATELREIVATLPRNRVVIETDAPWLTPAPFRGKPNRTAYLPYILRKLAEVWSVSESEADSLTTENALAFFPKLN